MSQSKSILKEKSFTFAIEVVKAYKMLVEEKREFVMSKQLLRSGTSIGANLAEAQAAISKADFTAKIFISAKECRETQYWIELLFQTDYLDKKQYESILTDSVELGKMLSSMTKKLQPNGRLSSTEDNH